jgi:hypothetical protein
MIRKISWNVSARERDEPHARRAREEVPSAARPPSHRDEQRPCPPEGFIRLGFRTECTLYTDSMSIKNIHVINAATRARWICVIFMTRDAREKAQEREREGSGATASHRRGQKESLRPITRVRVVQPPIGQSDNRVWPSVRRSLIKMSEKWVWRSVRRYK